MQHFIYSLAIYNCKSLKPSTAGEHRHKYFYYHSTLKWKEHFLVWNICFTKQLFISCDTEFAWNCQYLFIDIVCAWENKELHQCYFHRLHCWAALCSTAFVFHKSSSKQMWPLQSKGGHEILLTSLNPKQGSWVFSEGCEAISPMRVMSHLPNDLWNEEVQAGWSVAVCDISVQIL